MATELACKIRGTRPNLGNELHHRWVSASDADCEPLIFSDLMEGDKFIIMPEPGDNSGHGGLLEDFYVFMKVEEYHNNLVGRRNCIRMFGGCYNSAYVTDNNPVIKIG